MKESPEKMNKAVKIGLRRCFDQLRNDAATMAPYKSGNLKRSISGEAGTKSVTKLYANKAIVGTNLKYARIHDQGGTIPAHTIFPKKKKALRFLVGGKWVVVKSARIPARRVKPFKGRGYLTPAFKKLASGDAEKIFNEEMNIALK